MSFDTAFGGRLEPNEEMLGRKLELLLQEYRAANPDCEPAANFMPGLWHRIEARRKSPLLLRRLAEGCLVATVALAFFLVAFVLPHYQQAIVYQSTYVDALAAADSSTSEQALVAFYEPVAETE